MEPELKKLYNDKVRESLLKELNLKNVHQVPRLDKIVINCSIGSQAERKQAIEDATNEVTLITGQKPMTTFSKKAIASFKLRAGEPSE
jgi:large subunit ribosomal protein L5